MTSRTEISLVQSELCSYIFICILTDQSEQPHSNQSGHCYLDQCKDLESLFAQKWTNQGLGADTVLCIGQPQLVIWSVLSVSIKAVLPDWGCSVGAVMLEGDVGG